ncbi:hypothetical protein [Thermoleptolyngbya sp. M55_K2018_002]|uniref:hypothetical protein n=1 Tax=Thermoleptolyngbya sp. M55_K2018_002 TaxID=2747808 RepID=UPI001A010469|nr:hypothetical protein [Thermoleptolyngbya sp. M55_K2018_002]HIK42139.1 hypothetical protein [Thermoleptolyngbya sp. M55_K2018_002]
MSYVIRHGRSFWLQPSPGKAVRWGSRATALTYASEAEAFCVAAFLFDTGHYAQGSLTVEALDQEFVTIPAELMQRLQDCCLRVMNPSKDRDWVEAWQRFALLAGDRTQGYFKGKSAPAGCKVVDVDHGLLKDLQLCAAIVATPHPGDPVARAEFAAKTLQLSLNYYTPQEIES